MNNLLISYDLKKPGQDYRPVIETTKRLGDWAHIHGSFWYVRSNYSSSSARDIIVSSMTANDTVLVVDASNNDAAWKGLSAEASSDIQGKWSR